VDSNEEALGVDVFGSKLEGFGHAESALVEEGEVGAVATITEGPQEKINFFAGEDVREGFVACDFDFTPDAPFEAEVISVEGA